ncbi:ankyrin-1-like [Triticum urartu]|nr:ankyrin-1-like [Triticum urartu]
MGEDDRESLASVRLRDVGALHAAASKGDVGICKYLVEELRFDVDSEAANPGSGATPLSFAVGHGEVNATRYFLEKGADPNIKDSSNGTTPLHEAVATGCDEIARLLLSKGANVDAPSPHGTPLVAAAAHGKFSAMKILLEHHADPNKVSWDLGTPLTTALYVTPERMNESTCLECMKLLVKAGADVNCTTPETPLAVATNNGLTTCVKYLLEVGANINVPAKQVKKGDNDSKASLKSSGAKAAEGKNYVAASKFYSEDKSSDKDRKARLKSQGAKAVEGKDYAAASKFYTEAIKLDPADAVLYSNRSLCHLKCGEAHAALVDANACISLNPKFPKGYYRKGAALMSLLEYKQASAAFSAGMKLKPENEEMQV